MLKRGRQGSSPRHAVVSKGTRVLLWGIDRPRTLVGGASSCLVLCAALTFGVFPVRAAVPGADPAAPLGVAIDSYAGDAVTTTTSAAINAGADVTYQVIVSNGTAGAQTDVAVPVTLAPNFSLQNTSISASTGTTGVSGGVLTWSIPTLAANASATLSYTETTDAPVAMESDPTSVSATSTQNNTASTALATIEVIPAANVSVAVTDGVDTVEPGASDAYTITVTNNGPSEAPDMTLTDTLSDGFIAFTAVSSIGGTSFSQPGPNQFQWTGIDLTAGASATFVLSGDVSSTLTAGSTYVNLATVQLAPGEIDTNPVYNDVDTDTVVPGADPAAPLGVAIDSYAGDAVTTTTSAAINAGADVTYQVIVSNGTAGAQTDVAVPVTLAPNFSLQNTSISASTGTTGVSGGVLTWSIPTLAANASATLSYTETTDAPVAMESDPTSVSATSTQNNTASTALATIEVIPAANVSVAVTDGVDTVEPGASDAYTITVTNNGPSEAPDMTLTDTLSDGFIAFTAVSSIGGTSFSQPGPNQFQWTGIDLTAGASATFVLSGDVSSTLTAGSTYVNLATVQLAPGEIDTNPVYNDVDTDTVVPIPQAISWTPPTTALVGTPATLSATGGGSGSPVVFSVGALSGAGVCNVSGTDGTTLAYTAAGTCVIDANQAGNAVYAGAPELTASITVNQVPVFTQDTPPTTVTAGNLYTYTFAASGGPAPSFALGAGAPSWLAIDPSSGALSGTPSSGTTSFSYSVVAANSVGNATAGPFTVTMQSTRQSRDADVTVGLFCPATVHAGSLGSCTFAVHNAGPATAQFVVAGLALPRWFTMVSSSGNAWWWGNDATFFCGPLPAGSTDLYIVNFRPQKTGTGVVGGAAFSLSPDPDWANNVAAASVNVTSGATPGG